MSVESLGVAEWGDPAGTPVLVLHGTPGSRNRRPADEEAVRAAGLRIVTYDRPGYGASVRQEGRRVVDCAADVRAIADDLRLDRFHVSGTSGGGPHALALGARLADRVVAVEAVVSVAPPDAAGLDWYAGMDPENAREYRLAERGEPVLRPELERMAQGMLAALDAGADQPLGDYDLDESDLATLRDPAYKAMLAGTIREAFRTGVDGWVDDDLAFVRPWGFDVAEVRVPVTVRYGAHDVLVPPSHSRWLADRLPDVRVVEDTAAGHFVTAAQQLARLVELVG